MILVIDTETTGFPRNAPADDPGQPHLVELAALLMHADGEPVAYVERIVFPAGWEIPDDAAAVHGITTERARLEGVELGSVMREFLDLCRRAEIVAAFNSRFDMAIVRTALARARADAAPFDALLEVCAMKAAAEVMQVPKASGRGVKNPNLGEAFAYFYGQPFEGAHRAKADVLACASVYLALQGRKRMVALPTPAPLPPPVSVLQKDDVSVDGSVFRSVPPESDRGSFCPPTVPTHESMTDDEVVLAIRESPGVWLEVCGMIEDKEKHLIRPKLNTFQWRMSRAYEWQTENNRPRRQVALKPRRVGGTTMGAACTYHNIRNHPAEAVMIADTNEKSEKLLKMYECFAENDGFDWQAQDAFQIRKLELGDSIINRRSAETPKATRGNTLQALHCSEVAFWPATAAKSADATNAALRTALAKHAETTDIQESTPNGASGVFHKLWLGARWPEYDDYWKKWDGLLPADEGEGNGYLRVFMAWYEHWEYAHPMASPAEAVAIMGSLSTREKRGVKLYGWTVEQIKWRRFTIKSDLLGDGRRFDEEYPEDPQQCWLTSGSPKDDTDGMAILEARCRAIKGEYGILVENEGRVQFKPTPTPNEAICTIWEHAKAGCHYLISVDPNSGKVSEGGGERDCTAVHVWRAAYFDDQGRRHDARLVARLQPHWRAEFKPTAKFIRQFSKLYGNCLVIVENNMGVGLIDYLKDEGANLYIEQRFDKVSSQWTPGEVGWNTGPTTRELPINALGDVVREQRVDIACPVVVSEMRTFVRAENGRYEASSGNHDDEVFAAGIALYNMGQATLYVEPVRKRQPPPDEKRWKPIG